MTIKEAKKLVERLNTSEELLDYMLLHRNGEEALHRLGKDLSFTGGLKLHRDHDKYPREADSSTEEKGRKFTNISHSKGTSSDIETKYQGFPRLCRFLSD